MAHALKTRPGRTWEPSAETHDASEDGTGRGTPLVTDTLLAGPDGHSPSPPGRGVPIIPIQAVNRVGARKQNGSGIGTAGDPMFTLDKRSDHAVAFDLAQVTSGENRSNPQPGGPAPTANSTSAGRIAVAQNATSGVRRLTPTECERLQSFQDGYTAIPVARVSRKRLLSPRASESYVERGEEVWRMASDAARYQALGNSMAVCVIRWIFERLEIAEAATRDRDRTT